MTRRSKMTRAELLAELESLEKQREAAPELVSFTARIPRELRDQIKFAAHTQGIRVQDAATAALQSYVDSLGRRES